MLSAQHPSTRRICTPLRLLSLTTGLGDNPQMEHDRHELFQYLYCPQDVQEGIFLLQGEQLKRHMLQPYLVAAPKRGVIGNSRYAQRLRKQIIDAARNR